MCLHPEFPKRSSMHVSSHFLLVYLHISLMSTPGWLYVNLSLFRLVHRPQRKATPNQHIFLNPWNPLLKVKLKGFQAGQINVTPNNKNTN